MGNVQNNGKNNQSYKSDIGADRNMMGGPLRGNRGPRGMMPVVKAKILKVLWLDFGNILVGNESC